MSRLRSVELRARIAALNGQDVKRSTSFLPVQMGRIDAGNTLHVACAVQHELDGASS
jgi:hypothetical protein